MWRLTNACSPVKLLKGALAGRRAAISAQIQYAAQPHTYWPHRQGNPPRMVAQKKYLIYSGTESFSNRNSCLVQLGPTTL